MKLTYRLLQLNTLFLYIGAGFGFNEEKCRTAGGFCAHTSQCPGQNYVSNKCPTQSSRIKCCLSLPYQESKCDSAGGTCQDETTCNRKDLRSVSGKCPTQPAGIKCCLEKTQTSDIGTGFSACLSVVLQHEGGFVNHPKDPGGATNLGVTKRTYEAWVGHSVTIAQIKALTKADVTPIYKKRYWKVVKGDNLPHGLDLHVFDFGVNAGPSRAVKLLQTLVGVTADGAIGPATLAAVKSASSRDLPGLIRKYGQARLQYYKSLKIFSTFGKGWTKRVEDTTDTALKMAQK